MLRARHATVALLLIVPGLALSSGCGATRSTDTLRTATEQLLISDAIDRAVESMDLKTLAGQTVFLDDSKVADIVDRNYYVSTLRQQLLANGCELRDKREEADFIVEARAGAVGTDRNDLLFGLPSMNVPQIPLVQPVPAAIPEIPIAKRRDQRGIAKIAVFAYHRATGTPVWQSGIVRQESSANDVWIFGAGPFQRGTIYEGTSFAGKELKKEGDKGVLVTGGPAARSVSQEALFTAPEKLATKNSAVRSPAVKLAAHEEPVPTAKGAAPVRPADAPVPAAAAAQRAATAAVPPAAGAVTSTPPKLEAEPVLAAPAVGVSMSSVAAPLPVPPINSAYARAEDATPLPHPRFNSPQ
jgi:hypothetical protein